MKSYISKKHVKAESCTSDAWMCFRKTLATDTGAGYSDASLEGGLQGYMVVYNIGEVGAEYWSWSPKEAFEDGYTLQETESSFKTVTKFA